MMRRPCTRRKKSSPAHYADCGAVSDPGPGLEAAGPGAAPGAGQADAMLWTAMPGTRESLCESGATNGNLPADDGSPRGDVGPDRPGAGANRPRADERPAGPLGHHPDNRPPRPSADCYPIAAPHARQAADA